MYNITSYDISYHMYNCIIQFTSLFDYYNSTITETKAKIGFKNSDKFNQHRKIWVTFKRAIEKKGQPGLCVHKEHNIVDM